MPAKGSVAKVPEMPKLPPSLAKKYKSGQNTIRSGLCIATNLDGSSCDEPQAENFVPYCKKCMKNGDPSMKVLPHPKFGKMLVAARDLPANYYSTLWGEVMTDKEMPPADTEWGFETHDGDFVNPVKFPGAQIQFCQCPGPNERVTITFANPNYWLEDLPKGKRGKEHRKNKFGSFIFVTSMPVPKNHQLMMMYAESEKATENFFAERGIVRCDIGTDKYPAIRKLKAMGDAKKKPAAAAKGSKMTQSKASHKAALAKKSSKVIKASGSGKVVSKSKK